MVCMRHYCVRWVVLSVVITYTYTAICKQCRPRLCGRVPVGWCRISARSRERISGSQVLGLSLISGFTDVVTLVLFGEFAGLQTGSRQH